MVEEAVPFADVASGLVESMQAEEEQSMVVEEAPSTVDSDHVSLPEPRLPMASGRVMEKIRKAFRKGGPAKAKAPTAVLVAYPRPSAAMRRTGSYKPSQRKRVKLTATEQQDTKSFLPLSTFKIRPKWKSLPLVSHWMKEVKKTFHHPSYQW
jgi:hypothetical protein